MSIDRKFFIFLSVVSVGYMVSLNEVNSLLGGMDFFSVPTAHTIVDTNAPPMIGFIPGNITYGHVHMAKTAGSTLNSNMAARFERVCGVKGYSFDFYQVDQRRNHSKNTNDSPTAADDHEYKFEDTVSRLKKGYSRARVNLDLMWERGFDNCDFISMEEGGAIQWLKMERSGQLNTKHLQLHIPCREPITHLLSMCGELEITFDCRIANTGLQALKNQVNQCANWFDRFDKHILFETPPPLGRTRSVKCFTYNKFEEYHNYMAERLQLRPNRKRSYFYETSAQVIGGRNKSKDCLLEDEYSHLREAVQKHLYTITDYYSFCEKCIGSENDLF